jgi:hypothetical protein
LRVGDGEVAVSSILSERDPKKVRAGALGAAKRWGDPSNRKIVRLDQLDADTARLIRALLAQTKAAPVVTETSTETATEARRVRDERPSAA